MEIVKVQTADQVAVVTMANPPANLFTGELAARMLEAVRTAESDGARAMVLRGQGPVFSGGVDVNLFRGTSPTEARILLGNAFELISAIEQAPFPIIAAVHGLCLAAGLEIALACDLIIAAEGTQFAQVEAKIGAATFLGGVYRLAERAGTARAFEITFGGEFFDAALFERWNIINRVVPAATLEDEAWQWAGKLAAGPTAAHATTKKLAYRAADHGVRDADRYLLEVAPPLFATSDLQHAVELMLTNGARKFMANHDQLMSFQGR